MFLEHYNLEEEKRTGVYPFAGFFKEEDKVQKFEDSFEGMYIFAGTDFKQQVNYVVAQALKIEGLLMDDISVNLKMIKTISGMILSDPEMSESVKLAVERFGK